MTGGYIRNELGHEERVEAGATIAAGVALDLFLERMQAADTRSPDDAGPVRVDAFDIEPGVVDGLVAGHEGILGEGVHFFELLRIKVFLWLIVLDFAGELGFEFFRVETGNRRGAAATRGKALPKGLEIVADGRKGPHTGYDNPFGFHCLLRSPCPNDPVERQSWRPLNLTTALYYSSK